MMAGNHVQGIKDSYKRYLAGVFRQAFQLTGTPLRVQFNQGDNPFAEPEERKQGEGIVSMRRRKTAERATMNARRNEEQGRKAGKQPGVVASARNIRKKPAIKK